MANLRIGELASVAINILLAKIGTGETFRGGGGNVFLRHGQRLAFPVMLLVLLVDGLVFLRHGQRLVGGRKGRSNFLGGIDKHILARLVLRMIVRRIESLIRWQQRQQRIDAEQYRAGQGAARRRMQLIQRGRRNGCGEGVVDRLGWGQFLLCQRLHNVEIAFVQHDAAGQPRIAVDAQAEDQRSGVPFRNIDLNLGGRGRRWHRGDFWRRRDGLIHG